MNTFVPLSPLEEITEIVNKMDTAAPLPALQRVGKLLRENPGITNQSCEVIERVFMSAPSQKKRNILYLMDYLFKQNEDRCIRYFTKPLPSIITSFFDSANNEMREKIASIVGGWAKAGFFPEVMGGIIDKIRNTLQDDSVFQRVWCTPFNNALYSIAQQSMPRQAHQETIIDNDYFDDDEVDDDIMDEEFNPSFTINQSLLNERVYPTLRSHFDYIIKIIRYQLEQNKRMPKMDSSVVLPVNETEVGTMIFKFSDWSNVASLLLVGRDYFSRLNKHLQKCDTCGVYFKKDGDYRKHLTFHRMANEEYEKGRVQRGLFKDATSWCKQEVVEEVKEEAKEEIQYVEYDPSQSRCGWCNEFLEVVKVDDDIRKGRFFINAVQPVQGGPIYHIHCLQLMRDKKEVKKEDSVSIPTKTADAYDSFTFDY